MMKSFCPRQAGRYVLCGAGGRSPDARVGVGVAREDEVVVAHGRWRLQEDAATWGCRVGRAVDEMCRGEEKGRCSSCVALRCVALRKGCSSCVRRVLVLAGGSLGQVPGSGPG